MEGTVSLFRYLNPVSFLIRWSNEFENFYEFAEIFAFFYGLSPVHASAVRDSDEHAERCPGQKLCLNDLQHKLITIPAV